MTGGSIPLTPPQHWFFDQELPDPEALFAALLVELPTTVGHDALARAVETLLESHDALRLVFVREASGWRQAVNPLTSSDVFTRVHVPAVSAIEETAMIEDVARSLQGSLDLARGPLVRFAWLDLEYDPRPRLLIVAHYLITDAVALDVVLEELQATVESDHSRDVTPRRPLPATSYASWAFGLEAFARSSDFQREIGHWQASVPKTAPPLPDEPGGSSGIDTVTVGLDPSETTDLVRGVASRHGVQVAEALISGLARVLHAWCGYPGILMEVISHGRSNVSPDMDVSRTVGRFATRFPLYIRAGGAWDDPADSLDKTVEQLRDVPRSGIGYWLLRFARRTETSDVIAQLANPDIGFNYLGRVDQSFGSWRQVPVRTDWVPLKDIRKLYVDAFLSEGRLQVTFIFLTSLYRRETVLALAEGLLRELRLLARTIWPS